MEAPPPSPRKPRRVTHEPQPASVQAPERTVRPDIPQAPGQQEGYPLGHQPIPPEYGPYPVVDTIDAVETTAKRLKGSDDDGSSVQAQIGNRFARGVDVAVDETQEWLDKGPACVQFSYYDRVGGGGGACIDTSEDTIQLNTEAGGGTAGGFSVDRPEELAENSYCGVGAAVLTGGGGGDFLVGAYDNGEYFTDSSVYPGFGWRRGRAWPGGLGMEGKDGKRRGRPGPWGWTPNNGGRHRANPGARGRLGGYLAGTAQGKVYVTCGDVFHY